MEILIEEYVKEITTKLLSELADDVELEFEREGDQYRINIVTKSPDVIYGQRGDVLSSVQHITRVLVHQRYKEDRTHFLLDVNNARKKREKYINESLPELAKSDVLTLGKTVVLGGLSSYERRIIHGMMTDVDGLETSSVGSGNDRRLLIRPTSQTGSQGMENAKIIDMNRLVSSLDD